MQNADTVLGVLRERGRQSLPLERLYRQLFNEQLFLVAYGRIYANDGSMTAGVDGATPDGMSLGIIKEIIRRVRAGRYRVASVDGSTSRRRTERGGPWGCLSGRTNSSGRWCVCC